MVTHSYAPEWSYEETKNKIIGIPEPHFRQFAAFSYSLGARINEVRQIERKNIKTRIASDGIKRLWVTFPTEKNPRVEFRTVPLNFIHEKHYIKEIGDWYKDPGNQEPLDYYKIVKDKKTMKVKNIRVDFPFYRYTEQWYRKKIRHYLDIHPHAFRHLRVHHIDDKSIPGLKGMTPRQYQDYFGWETIATSSKYQSRTRIRDLADNF